MLSVALRVLATDRATVAVCGLLDDAQVGHVLLKGPTTAHWLYADPGQRSYVDVDLLVRRRDLPRAAETLRAIGLEAPLADASVFEQDGHSVVLRPTTPGMCEVDLHHSLPAVGVSDDILFAALARHRSTQVLLQRTLPTLDEVARSLVVVLHAARNGLADAQSTEDLRLLLAHGPDWAAVLELADEVQARPALARGLRLLPAGADVARRLGVEGVTSVEMELREAAASALAFGLDRLARTDGLGPRVSLLTREVWPTPAFLRYWSQREGLPELPTPALRRMRITYLAHEAVPAYRQWRAARRRAR